MSVCYLSIFVSVIFCIYLSMSFLHMHKLFTKVFFTYSFIYIPTWVSFLCLFVYLKYLEYLLVLICISDFLFCFCLVVCTYLCIYPIIFLYTSLWLCLPTYVCTCPFVYLFVNLFIRWSFVFATIDHVKEDPAYVLQTNTKGIWKCSLCFF